jgi:hypothetical protein
MQFTGDQWKYYWGLTESDTFGKVGGTVTSRGCRLYHRYLSCRLSQYCDCYSAATATWSCDRWHDVLRPFVQVYEALSMTFFGLWTSWFLSFLIGIPLSTGLGTVSRHTTKGSRPVNSTNEAHDHMKRVAE